MQNNWWWLIHKRPQTSQLQQPERLFICISTTPFLLDSIYQHSKKSWGSSWVMSAKCLGVSMILQIICPLVKKNPCNTCTDTLSYYFLCYDKAQKTNVYWICHAILMGKQVSLSFFKDKLRMTCLFSEKQKNSSSTIWKERKKHEKGRIFLC